MRRMLDVERHNSNALQPDVLRLRAMRLPGDKLPATHLGVNPIPHSIREMVYIIRHNWSGCIWKKNQPEAAASGGGGTGCRDDTTLLEGRWSRGSSG